jgi:hypothetical protein
LKFFFKKTIGVKMKLTKFFAFFAAALLLSSVSFADVTIKEDGVWKGQAEVVNVSTGLDVTVSPNDTANITANAAQAISGGTIDNSPIGATTPSTGAFTTLTAASGKTVYYSSAATALTAGTTVTLTVAAGNALFTDTITTDNQDQTINASAGGTVGDAMRIIFVTDAAGSGDEVITFGTNIRSTGTLTLANAAASRYVVSFVSDGTKWNEVSRTAIQAA